MILSLALGLALIQQPAFRTDTTIAVQAATRLDLELAMGAVTIQTWGRNQVRLRARHSARTSLDIDYDGAVLRVEAEGRMGMPGDVELELSVPASMGVNIEGLTIDVDAQGMRGPLRVESMAGDIAVRDAGDLRLESMNGSLRVAGARGQIALGSVSHDIVASGLAGEVTAESVSGDIWLQGTESSSVVAETVSGMIVFQGAVRDGGSYALASHSGNIVFALPAGSNATVSTMQASGRVVASFTLPTADARSRRRQSLRFGTGSASVELESFSGTVRLIRPDEVPTRAERRDQRERDGDFDRDDWIGAAELSASILAEVDLAGLASLPPMGSLTGLAALGADLAGLRHDLRRELRPERWREIWPDLRLDLDLRPDRTSRGRSPDRLER